MKTTEQSIRDRIFYIGDKLPQSVCEDTRPKFVVLGTPQEVIDETDAKIKNKSIFEISMWIAEYAHKMANPNGRFSEPPSMVYEQVDKDFNNFLKK